MSIKKLRTWELTLPINGQTWKDIHRFLSTFCNKFAFQEEKGTTTGYPHYQIRIRTEKQYRWAELKKRFENSPLAHAHMKPTSTKASKNFDYVIKSDTRVNGPWTESSNQDELSVADLKLDIIEKSPYPWQSTVKALIEQEPHPRRINIIIEPNGNHGKSSFIKYMHVTKRIYNVHIYDDATKMMGLVINHVKKNPKTNAFTFDFNKTFSKQKEIAVYDCVESVKNGMLVDWRYDCKEMVIANPHIW